MNESRTLYIESEAFCGNTIFNSHVPPYGYCLEHVEDINTHIVYTVIFKGDKRYSYEERSDGSLIY